VKQPKSQWSVPLVALLVTVLAGFEFLAVQRPASPAASGNPQSPSLSLLVQRRGHDLLMTWNRHAPAILHAKAGLVLIRDGNAIPQELHLDADQLRNGTVLYTPVSNNVQFRMEVLGAASGQSVNEAVVALTGLRGTPLAGQRQSLPVGYPASCGPVCYAVQVGTFRNRANAERLRYEMEVQYGPSRLVPQAGNPALWRVVVGRSKTSEDATRLAERIRTGGSGDIDQVLVVHENIQDPI
jgi:sporulation related protein